MENEKNTDTGKGPNWVDKLKKRWNLKSGFQVFIILLVFACTGSTVAFLKRPLFALMFPEGDIPTWVSIMYWILIFPIYNVILLMYGFIFGQFRFFWEFEKKFFRRILGRKKKEDAKDQGQQTKDN